MCGVGLCLLIRACVCQWMGTPAKQQTGDDELMIDVPELFIVGSTTRHPHINTDSSSASAAACRAATLVMSSMALATTLRAP